MPAGPELDRLIFDKVMGGIPTNMQHPDAYWDGFYNLGGHGHYSTNIAHAMDAIKPMLADDWVFNLKLTDWGTFIEFQHKPEGGGKGPCMEAEGDTVPLALMRAALKAKEMKP